MKYEIGDKVITKQGKGIIIEFSVDSYGDNCYLIKLENGLHIWRKENFIEKIVE